MTKILFALGFVLTIVGANYAVEHYGLITVWPLPHLVAPAGVLFAGLAFGLRDALHELGGHLWVLGAIVIGAVVSYIVGDAITLPGGVLPLAAASAIAFTVSELADWMVYSPLRHRHWPAAVFASNGAGAIIDSALFLWLAFGSLNFLAGQVVGKLLMVVFAVVVVGVIRSRHPAHAAA